MLPSSVEPRAQMRMTGGHVPPVWSSFLTSLLWRVSRARVLSATRSQDRMASTCSEERVGRAAARAPKREKVVKNFMMKRASG